MKKVVTLVLAVLSFNVFSTDPKEAYEMVKDGKAITIDVREEDELKAGMIKDAKWFPLSKIENNEMWKKEFKKMAEDKTIFLYCRTGRRSDKVMKILKEAGIESNNIGGYETLKKVLPVNEAGVR